MQHLGHGIGVKMLEDGVRQPPDGPLASQQGKQLEVLWLHGVAWLDVPFGLRALPKSSQDYGEQQSFRKISCMNSYGRFQ